MSVLKKIVATICITIFLFVLCLGVLVWDENNNKGAWFGSKQKVCYIKSEAQLLNNVSNIDNLEPSYTSKTTPVLHSSTPTKPTPVLHSPTPTKPSVPNTSTRKMQIHVTTNTKFSIGYITSTTVGGYNKISANVTLSAVNGLDKQGEVAYNFFGVDGLGDKKVYNSIDFGFCKTKDTKGWTVVANYATTDKSAQTQASTVSKSRNPGASVGSYERQGATGNKKITYRVWSSYSKIITVPDNTKVFFELSVSGKDEITLHIKHGTQDIKLVHYFSGANLDGTGLRFRRECNLIAEGKSGAITASTKVFWENLYKYTKTAKVKWIDAGHFYCDNGNKLPTNIYVKQNLPITQTVIYGIDKVKSKR